MFQISNLQAGLRGPLGFVSSSALINIILAAMIIFRLIYHRRHIQNALGVEHGSPYTNVMIMLVESSALMVISSGLFSILSFTSIPNSATMGVVILHILPHIYVGGLPNDF